MSLAISSLMCFLSGIVATCDADSDSPVVKVRAYQREVVPGVPGSPQGKGTASRQEQFSIYLETKPASKFDVVGVWMKGTEHSVNVVVKPSPVRFDNPVVFEQEERNIAVPKTGNQVTEIIVKTPKPNKAVDKDLTQLLKDNQAVVELKSGGKTIRVPVKAFQKRDPVFLR
jgi:hypothetical protein